MVKNIYFFRCELAGTVNDSMEVCYRIWSEEKRNRNGIENDSMNLLIWG